MTRDKATDEPDLDWNVDHGGGMRFVEMKGPGKQQRIAIMSLKTIRKKFKFTQERMAEEIGKDASEVSRIEQRAEPRISTLRRYAKAFGGKLELHLVFPGGKRVVIATPSDPT